MTLLAVLGSALTAAGLAGLGHCIIAGLRVRREKPAPEVARARLQRLVAVNLGSVALAGLGLALLVAGLALRG
jgi:beta-phosphoglucomutase-like phosphatase (HAD superfamily)